MKRLLFLFSLLVFGLPLFLGAESNITSSNGALYQPKYYPFARGEKAEYRVSWNKIPVGSAKVQMNPKWDKGVKFYQVNVLASNTASTVSRILQIQCKIFHVFAFTFTW